MKPEKTESLQINRTNWRFIWIMLMLVFVSGITACSSNSIGLAGAAGAQETLVAEALSATPASPVDATQTPMLTPVADATPEPSPEPIPTEIPGPIGVIAYISKQDGQITVMMANVDGNPPIPITQDGAEKNSLAWSPDGQEIAFAANVNDNWDVYVVNVNDGYVTRLTNSAAKDWLPSWSPDGRMLAFESFRDSNFELYRIDRDGGNLFQLTDNPAGDAHPAWSPEGQWIAFVSNRDGNADIYRMDIHGSNVQRLTRRCSQMPVRRGLRIHSGLHLPPG